MVAYRASPKATDAGLAKGIPIFLDQIIETLRVEQTSERGRSPEISGVAGGGTPSQIGDMATLHGRNLLNHDFTLEQVVRDYGDVCQAVTNLAYELGAPDRSRRIPFIQPLHSTMPSRVPSVHMRCIKRLLSKKTICLRPTPVWDRSFMNYAIIFIS